MQNNIQNISQIFFLLILPFTGCSIQSHFIKESYNISSPADSVEQTIFLIGDAGEPLDAVQEPTFNILTRQASLNSENNTIIFLGDNIYPNGLPEKTDPDRPEMERRLNAQIDIGRQSGARTIFIPGNHDWDYSGRDGLASINRQNDFIRGKNIDNITMLPNHGMPGPSVVDPNDNVRIIVLDTEWWLHKYQKPLYQDDSIETQTTKRFLDSLTMILAGSQQRNVLVVGHHPLRTFGEHGGFFDWKDHVFPLRKLSRWLWIPLPVIGSLYPVSRILGISDQDMAGTNNKIMRTMIDSVLAEFPVIAYASGHEHALQVINKESHHYYLVSGKGIQNHYEALSIDTATIAATRNEGFMRLDVLANGKIRLAVIAVEGDSDVEIFSMFLN